MKWDARQLRMFRIIGNGVARRIITQKEHRAPVRMLQISVVLQLGYELALLDQKRMARRRRRKN
jgi:hypothetical protein